MYEIYETLRNPQIKRWIYSTKWYANDFVRRHAILACQLWFTSTKLFCVLLIHMYGLYGCLLYLYVCTKILIDLCGVCNVFVFKRGNIIDFVVTWNFKNLFRFRLSLKQNWFLYVAEVTIIHFCCLIQLERWLMASIESKVG